jgi:hypothetical protein
VAQQAFPWGLGLGKAQQDRLEARRHRHKEGGNKGLMSRCQSKKRKEKKKEPLIPLSKMLKKSSSNGPTIPISQAMEDQITKDIHALGPRFKEAGMGGKKKICEK